MSCPPSGTCTNFCFHSFLDGLDSSLPLRQLRSFPVELFPRFLPGHRCAVDLFCPSRTCRGEPHPFPWLQFLDDFQTKFPPHLPRVPPAAALARPVTGLLVCHPEWSLSEPSDFVTPMLYSPLGGTLGGVHSVGQKQLLHSLAPASGWTFLLPHSPPHCTSCFQDSLPAQHLPPLPLLNPAEQLSKAQPCRPRGKLPWREVTLALAEPRHLQHPDSVQVSGVDA